MTISVKRFPKIWKRIKASVTKSSKGGKSGKWSARKAQLATHLYRKEVKSKGYKSAYVGKKSRKNSLSKWSEQDWGYVNKSDSKKNKKSRGRYFPANVRKQLSSKEKISTNRRKRNANKRGDSKARYTRKEARLVRNA